MRRCVALLVIDYFVNTFRANRARLLLAHVYQRVMQPERIPVRNSRRTIFRLQEPGPLTNLSALADESPEGIQLRPSGDCNTHKKLSKLCCNRCCIVPGCHPPDRPQPPGLAPEEDEFRPAFQLLSACPGGNPGYQPRLPRAHPPRPVRPDRARSGGLYPKSSAPSFKRSPLGKRHGFMALTGRRPAEIFFSAKFSLPKKNLAWPALIFDGQLKTRNAPGTSFEPYPIP